MPYAHQSTIIDLISYVTYSPTGTCAVFIRPYCGQCRTWQGQFQGLPVASQATQSLEDMLKLFTAPERLDKQNSWKCAVPTGGCLGVGQQPARDYVLHPAVVVGTSLVAVCLLFPRTGTGHAMLGMVGWLTKHIFGSISAGFLQGRQGAQQNVSSPYQGMAQSPW